MICPRCEKEKDIKSFRIIVPSGNRRKVCSVCEHSKSKRKVVAKKAHDKWRAKLPGAQNILRKYGITQEDYQYLLNKQNNVCAICCTPRTEGKRRLAVDHDHANPEKIRGLLCGLCNIWLGRIKDSSSLALRSFLYLERITCPSMSSFVDLVQKNLILFRESKRNSEIPESVLNAAKWRI